MADDEQPRVGWIGRMDQVTYYLAIVRADRDEDGKFLIYGDPVITGLDPNEAVVPGGVEYSVEGRKVNLAAGLNSTSYGLRVMVY